MAVEVIRKQLLAQLFPDGFPRLWCPPLTHFRFASLSEPIRIHAHLKSIAPFVRGILVPGSTGEGWEMENDELKELVATVLDKAEELGMHVLIGALKVSQSETMQCISRLSEFREHPACVGITVCGPKGREKGEEEIRSSLEEILTLGWPTSIYQLPQVTENELSGELVASLASSFPNFLCFKDSSGTDRVALSGLDFAGLKLLRGAEVGGYATWLKNVGGPYDAFLLSTANIFARQFCEMISLQDGGDAQSAHVLAAKLEDVVSSMFATVAEYPFGNAFCNVNKALDHCFAYGREAIHSPLPMLHCGERLPMEFIEAALRLLRQHELFNEIGYLA